MRYKKTFAEIDQQVFINSLNTCHYISGIAQPGNKILVECIKHHCKFEVSYDNIRKESRKHLICPECQKEKLDDMKVELRCDYCGKSFLRSKAKALKYDFHFCCRACKDKAQSLESGDKFIDLRPDHYGVDDTIRYREHALKVYGQSCEICGWDEDTDVLEVHHIDENRSHNNIENLIVLCPICHKKLTTGKYYLNRADKAIIKK